MLTGWLDWQRATVAMKCESVSEADARRALLPSSPAMTIAGVVSHLRWVEHGWFEVGFLGEPDRGPSTDDDPHAEWARRWRFTRTTHRRVRRAVRPLEGDRRGTRSG